MSWLEISTAFPNCIEVLAVKKALGVSREKAMTILIALYMWAYDNCDEINSQTGRKAYNIEPIGYDIICLALGLPRTFDEKLFDALCDANLLDKDGVLSDTINIHMIIEMD